MWIVSNRICVKKGQAALMAPRFTRSKALCDFEGFVKVEVWVSEQDEYDEMNVNMYWQSMEAFQVWRESDAFKEAHKRPSGAENSEANPVISSQLVVSKVAATLVNEAI